MRGSVLVARAAMVVIGLATPFLLLEAALQVAAFGLRLTGREISASWATGSLRVLCVGDSNTYGLWLDPSESYPSQLEARWNERVDRPKIDVINVGVPGMNSSRVARDLPRMLETFAPDVVIVMVGTNDHWTLPIELDEAHDARRLNFIERHSLVYKFYYLIVHSLDAREVTVDSDRPAPATPHAPMSADVTIRFGDEEFDASFAKAPQGLQGDSASLDRNLRHIARQASDFGVPLYFMTYPGRWGFYASAGAIIRGAAIETGTPLIDLARVFESRCPRSSCPEFLFPDHHPNARGYGVIAETLVERLRNDRL